MKLFSVQLATLATLVAFSTIATADDLDCFISKNSSEKFPVVETTKEKNEREPYETYEGRIEGEIHFKVLYVPFQHGILLASEDLRNGVKTEAVGHVRTELKYSVKNDTYLLICEEKSETPVVCL